MRTLLYGRLFNDKYTKDYEVARVKEYNVSRKWFIRMKVGGVATAMLSIFIMLMLINPVVTGTITVGLFISLVNATFGLIQSMSWELCYYSDSLSRNHEFFKELTKFSKLSEQPLATSLPVKDPVEFKKLEFKNVTFKYPNTENYILKNLSFVIESGKHYSFVGINGAGKTTMTKLITRLFTEYDGTILLNGKDIKDYPYSEIKSVFCGVFQDFAKYSISVRENIAVGNVLKMDRSEMSFDIANAVSLVSLNESIDGLKDGIDTYLGKIKTDGVDISGGQWQRIAIARGLYKSHEIIVLDEPTAAIDPIEETKIYHKFSQISKGKTSIIVTHRLGSVKIADRIIVMDKGEIAQIGTHEELLSRQGIYSHMWNEQAKFYV